MIAAAALTIWLGCPIVCGLQAPRTSSETASSDSLALDGVWLARSANIKWESELKDAWTSTFTVKGHGFVVSHFAGSSRDLNGTFDVDPRENPSAIDLCIDEIDLSDKWPGVKYPKCRLPGIYKLDGDVLTLCFQIRAHPRRPRDFVSRDWNTVVVSLSRAGPGFKGFPRQVTVTVKDGAGKPVPGAIVFNHMQRFHINAKGLPDPVAEPKWSYFQFGRDAFTKSAPTDARGCTQIGYDVLWDSQLAARDSGLRMTGITEVSPALLQNGTVAVELQPECVVAGTLLCDPLARAGKRIGWTNVILMEGGKKLAECDSFSGDFRFQVPPGSYLLRAYGTDLDNALADVVVPRGRGSLQVPPIRMTPQKVVALEGKPAPELEGIVGWKGNPVRLADLKGKYVVLDFWGYWCGNCVQDMAVLMALHDRFKDKGLAIVGVHVDIDGEIATAAKLDEKLASIRTKFWGGRDLPFATALTSGQAIDPAADEPHCKPALQYGIPYMTPILIDRRGMVVGIFDASDAKRATAQMEELLTTDK